MEPAGVEPAGLAEASLGRLVALAGALAGRRWTQYLADTHGLTPAGMQVLLELDKHGELALRQVADHCFVRPATVTGIVDTLERAGYVERRSVPGDRRSMRLALTDEGATRVGKLRHLGSSDPVLTSVDADPANALVIRRFLLELIEKLEEGGAGWRPQSRSETSSSDTPNETSTRSTD